MNPEPIAAALFDLVKDVPPVRFASRYRVGIEQLPEQPACIVGFGSASVQAEHGRPPRWTLTFDVGFIARVDGGEDSPESLLNEWLVNVQSALEPEGEKTQTLGGLAEHAWITGPVDYVPGDSGFPWMECWISVEVLAVR